MLEIPRFSKVVAVNSGGTVYVFPLDRTDVMFVWDPEEADRDWGFWYMLTEDSAYKVVLAPHGPAASIGLAEENWDEVLRREAKRIPPRVFFILTYIASSVMEWLGEKFVEPKIVSIKDFDRTAVRSLAARLKSQLLDRVTSGLFDDYDEFETDDELSVEEEEEEGPECYWCIDEEKGICYYCED